MNTKLQMATAAALLVVAVLLIFLPQSRTTAFIALGGVLWMAVCGEVFFRLWKAGVLSRRVFQNHFQSNTSNVSLLTALSIIFGAIAIVSLTI